MPTPSMVAPAPKRYRVVGTEVVVDAAKTIRCPWCPRVGSCPSCNGSERILAYKPGRYALDWPVMVVEVGSE